MAEYLSVEAPPEVIDEVLAELKGVEGAQVSEREGLESPADALDAPISGEEMKQLLEVVNVLLETGAAAASFWSVIRALKGRNVRVRDIRNGSDVPDPAETPGGA